MRVSAEEPGDILTAQGGNRVRVGLAFGRFFPSMKVTWDSNLHQASSFPFYFSFWRDQ